MQNQTNKKLNSISDKKRIENERQRSISRIAIRPIRHILFTASAMADTINTMFFLLLKCLSWIYHANIRIEIWSSLYDG